MAPGARVTAAGWPVLRHRLVRDGDGTSPRGVTQLAGLPRSRVPPRFGPFPGFHPAHPQPPPARAWRGTARRGWGTRDCGDGADGHRGGTRYVGPRGPGTAGTGCRGHPSHGDHGHDGGGNTGDSGTKWCFTIAPRPRHLPPAQPSSLPYNYLGGVCPHHPARPYKSRCHPAGGHTHTQPRGHGTGFPKLTDLQVSLGTGTTWVLCERCSEGVHSGAY